MEAAWYKTPPGILAEPASHDTALDSENHLQYTILYRHYKQFTVFMEKKVNVP
jgi:hypothetical protein